MKNISIHGYSDDLVYIETEGKTTNEITGPITEKGDDRCYICFDHPEHGDSAYVVAEYSDMATWRVGIQQFDEDQPIPDWMNNRITVDPVRHSVRLNIDVPSSVVLTVLDAEPKL